MKYLIEISNIIIVIYFTIIIIKRILSNSRLKAKKKYYTTKHFTEYIPSKKECIKIFSFAFLFRILVFILSAFIFYVFIENNKSFNFNDVANNWIKWDASNYIRISHSYAYYTENGILTTLAFFPIYPTIMKIINLIINNITVSGLIVSSICFSLGCVYLYKLICLDYSKKIAGKALILISIFPFAFFFGGIMSESTFLLFSTLTLYYTRKHKWWLVGIYGFFASLTRIIGVFLIIPAIIEMIEEEQIIKNINNLKYIINILIKKCLPLILIPMGIVCYLFINYYYTNDWLYFLKLQANIWNNHYTHFYYFINNIISTIKSFDLETNLIMFFPELITTIIMYFTLLIGIKHNRTMYSGWLLTYIIITTSITWPLSIGRYFSCAIPAFIYIAILCENKEKLYNTIIIISSILFTIMLIAYLFGKCIM